MFRLAAIPVIILATSLCFYNRARHCFTGSFYEIPLCKVKGSPPAQLQFQPAFLEFAANIDTLCLQLEEKALLLPLIVLAAGKINEKILASG